MNPRVTHVTPNPDYTLLLTFTNKENRKFDMKPYLDKGAFTQLKDLKNFMNVKPFLGSIQWSNELDLCPDTLYEDSVEI